MLELGTLNSNDSVWLARWRRWRRRSPIAALIPVQLFLAAGWARAAVEKLIDPQWWDGSALLDFLSVQREHMLPFFSWWTDMALVPLTVVVAGVVMASQFAIAGCLVANRFVRPALWGGVALNVLFVMAGAVNPSAFYLVMQLALLFAMARPVSWTIARRRATGWLMMSAFFVPFIQTITPADVIDDPAAMLSFVTALAAAGTIVVTADRDLGLSSSRDPA